MKKIIMSVVLTMALPGCGVWPPYNVWEQRLAGEAEYAKAESSRKIKILEANAAEEAAKALARAEVERAKGVAQANAIIGESLKNNESYLRWLYIEGLKENRGEQIIYVPTEAGLPILESSRLRKQSKE